MSQPQYTMSLAQARDAGVRLGEYDFNTLRELGAGTYRGTLDALVWARKPGLHALITLDSGAKCMVTAFSPSSGPDYGGLRFLVPGRAVFCEVTTGPRGGVRISVTHDPKP